MMDPLQVSFSNAYSAISVAVIYLDASLTRKNIQLFPLLRVRACELLCSGNVNHLNSSTDNGTLGKLCGVIGAIVSPNGKYEGEERSCSKRILAFLKSISDEILPKVVKNMVSHRFACEGCGLFVLRYLEDVFSSELTNERIEGICHNIMTSRVDPIDIAKSSNWKLVHSLLLKHQEKGKELSEAEVTDASSSLAPRNRLVIPMLKRPRFVIGPAPSGEDYSTKHTATDHSSSKKILTRTHGPPSEDDLFFLLKVIALYTVRPQFLLSLIRKHDVAHFIIDVIIYHFAGHLSIPHAGGTAWNEARVHEASLFRQLLIIVDGDPAVDIYDHSLLDSIQSVEDLPQRNFLNTSKWEVSSDVMLQQCVSVAENGRLHVLDISALTRRLIKQHLSIRYEVLEKSFELRSWMSTADVVDSTFSVLRTSKCSFRTLLSFWNNLVADGGNHNRVSEIDYLFTTQLASENLLRFWLAHAITTASTERNNVWKSTIELGTQGEVRNRWGSVCLDLIATVTAVASRAKEFEHDDAFCRSFCMIVVILESRFVWELTRVSASSTPEQRNEFFNGYSVLRDLMEALPDQDGYNRASVAGASLYICTCARVSMIQKNSCLCLKPQWRSFGHPDRDNWFFWTVLEVKSPRIGSGTDARERMASPSEIILFSGADSDEVIHSRPLFQSICRAIFDTTILAAQFCIGRPVLPDGSLPAEIYSMLMNVVGGPNLSLRENLLEDVELILQRVFLVMETWSSKPKSSNPRARRLLRVDVDAIFNCCLNSKESRKIMVSAEKNAQVVERILRLLFSSISELIAYMKEVPTFMKFAHGLAMEGPVLRAKSRSTLIYLQVLSGVGTFFERPSKNIPLGREDERSRRISLCFDQ